MKETAYYAENFNVAQFKWITYGAYGYGETYDEAHADAKQKVYRKCKEENPHLYFDEVAPKNGASIITHDYNNIIPTHSDNTTTAQEKINKGSIEEQIEACTTKDELESFKLIASMNPKLVELWGKKSKELLVHI